MSNTECTIILPDYSLGGDMVAFCQELGAGMPVEADSPPGAGAEAYDLLALGLTAVLGLAAILSARERWQSGRR